MGNSLTNDTLTKYFSDLQFRMNIYDKAQKDMDVYLASKFNVFEYINPKENDISNIMADLLNPQGKHGQKVIFLEAFLRLFTKNFPHDLINCQIIRETSTTHIINNQRRMDIVLNFADKFVIAIENKPWDSEQENQLQDYQQHLLRKCGENYSIVYISGDGSPPVSITSELKDKLIEEGKLIVLTYSEHMIDWLRTCYKECKAERIRYFINDFIHYIQDNFENSCDEVGVGDNGN